MKDCKMEKDFFDKKIDEITQELKTIVQEYILSQKVTNKKWLAVLHFSPYYPNEDYGLKYQIDYIKTKNFRGRKP